MLLPTSQHIHADPVATLPATLHRTRSGGLRPHCNAHGLAARIASGEIIVTSVSADIEPDGRLPRQVGSESEDHRQLRAATAQIILAADPNAVVGMEVAMTYDDRSRRFDTFAVTVQGVVVGFAGAVDGRDVVDLLMRNRVSHCVVMPFAGLRRDYACGLLFRRASTPPLPIQPL